MADLSPILVPGQAFAPASLPSIAFVMDRPDAHGDTLSFLADNGLQVTPLAWTGEIGTRVASTGSSVLLLDLVAHRYGLALSLLQSRTQADRGCGVIVLADTPDESDCVLTLELGADDYIARDCPPRELLARIRALMRRSRAAAPPERPRAEAPATIVTFGGWRYDLLRRLLVDPAQESQSLSGAEHEVLATLIAHAGQTVSRDALRRRDTRTGLRGTRAVDLQISHLRRRFGDTDEIIATVRGRGYRLMAQVRREPVSIDQPS